MPAKAKQQTMGTQPSRSIDTVTACPTVPAAAATTSLAAVSTTSGSGGSPENPGAADAAAAASSGCGTGAGGNAPAGLRAIWDLMERRSTAANASNEWAVKVEWSATPLLVKVLNRAPPIAVISNFMSAHETEEVLRICGPHFSPSVVGLPEEDGYFHDNRTSFSVHEARLPAALRRTIESRAERLCGLNHGGVEYLEIIRYLPKQHFREHHDGVHRRFSLVVYLNTLGGSNDGGETAFPALKLAVKPQRGSALLFASTKPATAGYLAPSSSASSLCQPPPAPQVAVKSITTECAGSSSSVSPGSPSSIPDLKQRTGSVESLAGGSAGTAAALEPQKETPSKAVSSIASNATPISAFSKASNPLAPAAAASAAPPAAAPPAATTTAVKTKPQSKGMASVLATALPPTSSVPPKVVEDPLARHESRDPTPGHTKYALSIFVKQPAELLSELTP